MIRRSPRALVLGPALAAALGLAAGCSGSTEPAPTKTDAAGAKAQATKPAPPSSDADRSGAKKAPVVKGQIDDGADMVDFDLMGAPEMELALDAGEVHEIVADEVAEANEQFWREESIVNELIAGPLRPLRNLMAGPWSRGEVAPTVEEVFLPDAQLASPYWNLGEPKTIADGVTKREWVAEDPEMLSVEDWMAALAEIHGASERVRWTQAKPAGASLLDDGAEVILKWRINRTRSDGGLVHDSGKVVTEWVQVGEEWRCRKLVPQYGSELSSEAPHFVDATLEAFAGTDIDPTRPTAMTGTRRGIALGDLDGDDDLDLVVTRPGGPMPLTVLFNRGDGTFVDRTRKAVPGIGAERWRQLSMTAALIADFDRDGDADFFIATRYGHATLFAQDENGVFRGKPLSFTPKFYRPQSLAAHDVDGDGWLDVFMCGYGPFTSPGPNDPADATNAKLNTMLRGLPGGDFEDVTEAWGLDVEGNRWAFMGTFGDVDDDGDQDLYVCHDFGPNVLYRRANTEGVHFDAEVETPDEIITGFSMSATWGDLDGDLDLDMYVSNMTSTAADRLRKMPGDPGESERFGTDINELRYKMSRGNAILLNEGGEFAEATGERGAKGANWAWGTALFDYDHDRDLDIACVNGMWTVGADDGRDL